MRFLFSYAVSSDSRNTSRSLFLPIWNKIPTLKVFYLHILFFFSPWVRQALRPRRPCWRSTQLQRVFYFYFALHRYFEQFCSEIIFLFLCLCWQCIVRALLIVAISSFLAGKKSKLFKTAIQHRQSCHAFPSLRLKNYGIELHLTSARRLQFPRHCGGIEAVSVPQPTRIPRILT
ncbi:hypothetical protein F5Y02DRAFT_298956 [Annulohypoxylon stygium]|nr:hypothetical protein F5Y02DRAFT_298956 [Annulohypoxylon stygium]